MKRWTYSIPIGIVVIGLAAFRAATKPCPIGRDVGGIAADSRRQSHRAGQSGLR
jgi:hypothetical protein